MFNESLRRINEVVAELEKDGVNLQVIAGALYVANKRAELRIAKEYDDMLAIESWENTKKQFEKTTPDLIGINQD